MCVFEQFQWLHNLNWVAISLMPSKKKPHRFSSTKCTRFTLMSCFELYLTLIQHFERFMWENLMKPWFMSLFILQNGNADCIWPPFNVRMLVCYQLLATCSSLMYKGLCVSLWSRAFSLKYVVSMRTAICLSCISPSINWTYANKNLINRWWNETINYISYFVI